MNVAVAEPGEVVFKLKPAYRALGQLTTIDHDGLRAALAALNARALRQPFPRAVAPDPKRPGSVDLRLTYRVRVPANVPFAEVQRRLLGTGAVAWVEPHYRRNLLLEPNDPLADSTLATGGQYHLKNIRAYRAWDIEDGDTTVVVGITDTGARLTHQDLKSQIAFNRADPPNGLDDDNDGYLDNYRGWDLADNDNDPSITATNVSNAQPHHGAQVSGVSSAAANNGRGGAGSGFNCRFLPIKIYNSTTAGGFAGYEGIVYAADHGCRVINCSWGGVGNWSQYEQDCIAYAIRNRDAVVVAAAGNTNAYLEFYPASYPGVLAVASLARDDTKAPTATFSHRISLGAPGRQIITAQYQTDSTYGPTSGSSIASPLVAGAVALVRTRFPGLTAAQAAERVRISADTSIFALSGNAAYRELIGRGRLDMLRALADPALRSVRLSTTSIRADTEYYGGDTLTVNASFRNLLAPLGGLRVTFSSPTAGVQVLGSPTRTFGPVGTLDTVFLAPGQAFRVVLPPSSVPNTRVSLRFGFADTAGGYRDAEYVSVVLNPAYITLDATAIGATVTSGGDLGYDHADPRFGRSVALLPGGDRLLSEGGLLVGAAPDRVSDRLRSATAGQPDDDFQTINPIRFSAHLPWAAQTATGIFADTAGPAQAGVRVTQRAWNTLMAGCARAAFVEYGIINQTADTLRTLYAGLFADWDIGQAPHNVARWDGARRLAYVASARPGADTAYAALQLLTAQPAATYAFDQLNATAPGPINATDGLTTAEKWAALVAAAGTPTTAGTTGGGTDVAHLVRAALPRLAPQDTVQVAWAILAAPSLAELTAAADSAKALFDATQQLPTVPVGIGASRCGPGAVLLTATGAPTRGGYRWYARGTGPVLAATPTYQPTIAATDTFFVSTTTRLGREGDRVPVLAVVDTIPAAPVLVPTPQPSGLLLLTAAGGQPVQFYFNGGALPATPSVTLTLSTAAQNGTYTATLASPAGCVSPPSNAIVATITGLPETAAGALQLYPNPTTGTARLKLPMAARITVFDAVGRVVLTLDAAAGEVALALGSQPHGVYSVRVQTGGGVAVKRLVRE